MQKVSTSSLIFESRDNSKHRQKPPAARRSPRIHIISEVERSPACFRNSKISSRGNTDHRKVQDEEVTFNARYGTEFKRVLMLILIDGL